jgi:hypothetical protein
MAVLRRIKCTVRLRLPYTENVFCAKIQLVFLVIKWLRGILLHKGLHNLLCFGESLH